MKTLPKTIYVCLDGGEGEEYMNAQVEPGTFVESAGDSRRVAVYERKGYVIVKSTVTTTPVKSTVTTAPIPSRRKA